MTSESQASAHVFIDKIKSLMLRIRTHLRDGELDLVQVIEIMVLMNGLSNKDGWPVLAMALSTDETLSFEVMCERILQQAERLSVSNGRGRPEASPSVGGGAGKGVAKSVAGKKSPKVSPEGGSGQTEKFRPYWHGQHAKRTYQPSVHSEETDRPTIQANPSESAPHHKPNKNKGKWKAKGKAHGKSAQGQTDEFGWALSTRAGTSGNEESEDESSSDDGLVDEPHPIRFKRLRYIDEVENILGRAFKAQGEDLPPELPELVSFEIPDIGDINTMDTPLGQSSTDSITDLSGSTIELTAAEVEAFTIEVEAMWQSDAFSPVEPGAALPPYGRVSRRKRYRKRNPELDDLPVLIDLETGEVVNDNESDDESGYTSYGSWDEWNDDDDDDDGDGIGISVCDPSNEEHLDGSAMSTIGVVDLTQDSDGDDSSSRISIDDDDSLSHSNIDDDDSSSRSSSNDNDLSSCNGSTILSMEEEPRWFDLQDITDRSGLPVREVNTEIYKSFLRSGQLTHEIVRYIRHCIEQCGAMETNGITARVPIRTVANTPVENDLQLILGRLSIQVLADLERDRAAMQHDNSTLQDSDIVSVVDAEDTAEQSDTSVVSDDRTERYPGYSIYSDNVSNSHRLNIFPGLRMRREMRFPVALLPRSLPDRCSTCLVANGQCSIPCNWVREHPTACGRYCDAQIQSGLRMSRNETGVQVVADEVVVKERRTRGEHEQRQWRARAGSAGGSYGEER